MNSNVAQADSRCGVGLLSFQEVKMALLTIRVPAWAKKIVVDLLISWEHWKMMRKWHKLSPDYRLATFIEVLDRNPQLRKAMRKALRVRGAADDAQPPSTGRIQIARRLP